MIPYKSLITINKDRRQAIYLQIANQLIDLIKTGTLQPNTQLPSSRKLADLIGLHRKTIVACYDELLVQGWLVSIPQKGTYVHAELPLLKSSSLGDVDGKLSSQASFEYYKSNLSRPALNTSRREITYINDGINDARLAPVQELTQMYRSVSLSKSAYHLMEYGSTLGNQELRQVLVKYLNETRGIKLSVDNIMITRGSQMGIYLATQLLLDRDDVILVGTTNYISADYTFLQQKARLERVDVDQYGIDTNAVERACQTYKVKAIYVTSHHHHPTTHTMSAERRLHLLNLSKLYEFAIIEDDYDFDFHYSHAPILPLVSHDIGGHVIYTGSLCKTVAPVYRVGYMIAPSDFIDEAAGLRRYIDRQGDALLELTFARFIKSGSLDRHINKVIKIYRHRRDMFAMHLNDLSSFFEYEVPSGGMAFWLKLKAPYLWEDVAAVANQHKLEIGEWQRYDLHQTGHNSIRLGFASYNDDEIEDLFDKLKATMKEVQRNVSMPQM